jgi:hypothetical protein
VSVRRRVVAFRSPPVHPARPIVETAIQEPKECKLNAGV